MLANRDNCNSCGVDSSLLFFFLLLVVLFTGGDFGFGGCR